MKAVLPRLALLVAALLGAPSTSTSAIFLVPSDETPTIAAALAVAASYDTVDVLPGTYFEQDLVVDRQVTVRGVAGAGQTVIDGQGLGRVINMGDFGGVLEGLTITHGAADFGAGIEIICCVTIRDCILIDNHAGTGGGIGLSGIADFPLAILDTVFEDNSADLNGGGMWLWGVDLTMSGCVFRHNSAGGIGGAADIVRTRGSVTDCLFDGNAAASEGGALYLEIASPFDITACTFHGNSAPTGGAVVYETGSTGALARTIVASTVSSTAPVVCPSGGPVFSCCDVFGNAGGNLLCGTHGGGNFSLDPLFCDPAGGDFRLHEDSPCLPGQHPSGTDCGGTIGALDVGCGEATSAGEWIEAAHWSRVKATFR